MKKTQDIQMPKARTYVGVSLSLYFQNDSFLEAMNEKRDLEKNRTYHFYTLKVYSLYISFFGSNFIIWYVQ